MIELAEGGIPLGMFPQFPYERGEITLAPSDLLVMWTDGVVELRDGTEEMFGVQRLTSLVRRHRHGGAAGVRDGIMNAVAEFGDNILEDDVTLLVVSISPGGDTTNAVQSHAATA